MGWLRKLVRALLTAAAVLVIVVALGVGGLRIVMTQLPSYQEQITRAVADTLDLDLSFDAMDVRFGLRGPELTFHELDLSAEGEDEPFLVAVRAAVVLDAWALLTEREIRPVGLAFDGARLALVRQQDGSFGVRNAPAAGERGGDLWRLLPAEIAVSVRDSELVFVDRVAGVSWAFADVAVDLDRAGERLRVEAWAEPPGDVGDRVELAASVERRADGLRAIRLDGDVRGADLAVLRTVLPDLPAWPQSGGGDATVRLEWRGGTFERGAVDAALENVGWSRDPGAAPAYDHVAVSASWSRAGDGWRVVLSDVDVRRGGRVWPPGADTVVEIERGANGIERLAIESGFLRLEDLTPVVAALPESGATLRWLELDPRGDLADLDLDLARGGDGFEYAVSGRFDRLGIEPAGSWPGFEGVSGEVRADDGGGRVGLDTRTAALEWPQLFRSPLDVGELSGLLVWREGVDGIRVVADDLALVNADGSARSSLELTLPLDGGSPQLDIKVDVGPFDAVAAKRYFPVHVMPPGVVSWLDNAIQGGDVLGAELELAGPIDAFPFDGGEGKFRVSADIEDGVLEFVDGWPRAEDLDGTIEFVNAGFAARGAGRVLGNASDDVRIGIADLRDAVLTVRTETLGPLSDVLAFLRGAPLIAHHLGPGYERLTAPGGTGAVTLDLALPLLDMPAYRLEAGLDIAGGELAIDGLAPHATGINGTLRFADGVVTGEGIEAVFLDGPATARVVPAGLPEYRARLEVEGEVTADAAAEAFDVPLEGLVAGQTRWSGSLMIPRTDAGTVSAPLRVHVDSNLSGVALRLPAPFEKAPGDATSLNLDFVVGGGRLDVSGHLGPTRRFALQFAGGDDGLELERGTLRFGGGLPELGTEPGLTVDGALPTLHFDEWLALVRGADAEAGPALASSAIGELFSAAELQIADFSVFGQELGASRLSVRRAPAEWLIEVDSAPVAGRIEVPRNLRGRPAVTAELARLRLHPREGGPGASRLDPRKLPGLRLSVDEFAFGPRRFGSLEADIRADPVGLRVVSVETRSDTFAVSGSGGWFDGPEGPATRLAFHLTATDVAAALAELDLDPIASGESAEITASVYWPGAPSADWTQHLNGDLSLRLETGSLLDIDPGAGRVMGLMSISALPRRLALDFRDVFNKGLVFDEIAGDFTIIDGNAYTDNLKVTGPVAEIGVAGRIGLRDRDYRQQAVVTAEPGKMLPTVGGLIGGPGVGAALLIFTRIFKEPLKGIGRASYCVTGPWEKPVVARLSAEQLERGELCAELPPGGLSPAEADP